MKILVAHPGPQFSVQDVYIGWVEALRGLGQDVREFNLGDRLTLYDSAFFNTAEGVFRKALTQKQAIELAANGLAAALYKLHPDVLLSVSTFYIEPDLLSLARLYGTRVVLLHTESPYEDDRQLDLAPRADLNLLNDPTNLARFLEQAPTAYMPHAYRPTIHHPGSVDPDLASEFAFVGTGFESRIAFFEGMNLDGLDVLLAGNWERLPEDSPLRRWVRHPDAECLDNEQTAEVYRSAKVGLNLYRREANTDHYTDGWAMGPREVEMAACGLFFLRDPRGEGDQVLDMLPTFTSPGDAADQLRYWLGHDQERQALAEKAKDAVADRTFERNATQLLRLLNEGNHP